MAFVDHHAVADVDPRSESKTIGSPGGEFGEFLGALAAFEHLTGTELTDTAVQRLVKRWLVWEGRGLFKFRIETDATAVDHLTRHLRIDGQTGEALDIDMRDPEPEYKDALLLDLTNSANQGVLYTKAVLRTPEHFFFPRRLPARLIQAMYKTLWDKAARDPDGLPVASKFDYVVFEGKSSPVAWLSFRGSAGCEQSDRAPLFAPSTRGATQRGSAYVHHPEASRVLRRKLAHFFALQSAYVSWQHMFGLMNRQADRALEALASAIPRVPFYSVTVE